MLDGIELMSSDFDFTREERRLVKMYRSLPPAKKQTIYSLVLWLSKEGGGCGMISDELQQKIETWVKHNHYNPYELYADYNDEIDDK